MATLREAREFEALVARIEKVAAPRGATVTLRDRLRNLITGSLQEVDVAIRYRCGTVDILISVECRNRSKKEDLRWIQELATKRTDLGIHKTIAVASGGFSSSAKKLAKTHSIELRTLSKVSTRDLHDWFLPTAGVVHVFRKFQELVCSVYLLCTDGGPSDYGLRVRDEFEPIFFHSKIHSPFPAATLLHLYELRHDDRFYDVPLDGLFKRIEFGIDGNLTIDGTTDRLSVVGPPNTNQQYAVHFVHFAASYGYVIAEFERDQGEHVRYSTPAGEIQRSTFRTQLFDLPFEFEHQHSPLDEDRMSFRVLRYESDT